MASKYIDFLISEEEKKFYTQNDEIERLLIERETYKLLYKEQQKRIKTFIKELDKLASLQNNTQSKFINNKSNMYDNTNIYDTQYSFV